jgi:hypothetical protein
MSDDQLRWGLGVLGQVGLEGQVDWRGLVSIALVSLQQSIVVQ